MADPIERSLPLRETSEGAPVELVSEFAAVGLSVDRDGNGPRLRIEDLKTGRVAFLDPLELESIAWTPKDALHPILDPSAHRWRDGAPRGA